MIAEICDRQHGLPDLCRRRESGANACVSATDQSTWMLHSLTLKEITMSIRNSLLAFAAVASLASPAFVPTTASAHYLVPVHTPHLWWPHGGWPHGYCWHTHACGTHIGVGVGVGVASSTTVVNGGGGGSVPVPVPVASAAPAVTPAPHCLTKRELPDGDALFRDLCTGEHAESQPQGSNPSGH
jgi:hypothetical protein